MALVIVCTTENRRVAVVSPTREVLDELRVGIVAARRARGYRQDPLDRDYEAGLFIRDTWRRDESESRRRTIAHSWIEALNAGGLSEREAVELIRDKDRPEWSQAAEIVDSAELPDPRWFDAWRRSPNGGPIVIDADHAKWIDAERAARAEEARIRQRAHERRIRRHLRS